LEAVIYAALALIANIAQTIPKMDANYAIQEHITEREDAAHKWAAGAVLQMPPRALVAKKITLL